MGRGRTSRRRPERGKTRCALRRPSAPCTAFAQTPVVGRTTPPHERVPRRRDDYFRERGHPARNGPEARGCASGQDARPPRRPLPSALLQQRPSSPPGPAQSPHSPPLSLSLGCARPPIKQMTCPEPGHRFAHGSSRALALSPQRAAGHGRAWKHRGPNRDDRYENCHAPKSARAMAGGACCGDAARAKSGVRCRARGDAHER